LGYFLFAMVVPGSNIYKCFFLRTSQSVLSDFNQIFIFRYRYVTITSIAAQLMTPPIGR